MAEREIRIHNKSDRPDNVIKKENDMYLECEKLEDGLPRFLRGFFSYLKGNVLPATRLAYLHDIMFFFKYLIEETDLTQAKTPDKIKLSDLEEVQAVDVNMFLDYCRRYKVDAGDTVYVYENSNKSLARKKSSVSVLFKYLYHDGLLEKNITDGFDPIMQINHLAGQLVAHGVPFELGHLFERRQTRRVEWEAKAAGRVEPVKSAGEWTARSASGRGGCGRYRRPG